MLAELERDWRDLGRDEGVPAAMVAEIESTPDGWRLVNASAAREVWPTDGSSLEVACSRGCGQTRPFMFRCQCGLRALMRGADAAVAGRSGHTINPAAAGRALLRVTLHGPVFPVRAVIPNGPAIVKMATATIDGIFLHDTARWCGRECLAARAIADGLASVYPFPVEVLELTADVLPSDAAWRQDPRPRPAGIGWRVTLDDFSSPWVREPRPVFTPPGIESTDTRGIYLARDPVWLALSVAGGGATRMFAASYDEADRVPMKLSPTNPDQEIVVKRIRVLGELTPEEIAGLAAGQYPTATLARSIFESLLPHLDPPASGPHDVDHWRAVLRNGIDLAAADPDIDPVVVAAFAALHDSRRLDDGADADHGQRAADLARTLNADGLLPLDEDQLETLCRALISHDQGLVSDEPTIGACWDSDRLELPRVGVRPNPRLLSTAAAREHVRDRS